MKYKLLTDIGWIFLNIYSAVTATRFANYICKNSKPVNDSLKFPYALYFSFCKYTI